MHSCSCTYSICFGFIKFCYVSLSSTETGLSIIFIVHKIIYLNTQDREMENERSWSEHVTQHRDKERTPVYDKLLTSTSRSEIEREIKEIRRKENYIIIIN